MSFSKVKISAIEVDGGRNKPRKRYEEDVVIIVIKQSYGIMSEQVLEPTLLR